MKKFLKTTLLAALFAAGTGLYDEAKTGHVDPPHLILGAVTGILGLWIKKPGTEDHESPLATGK